MRPASNCGCSTAASAGSRSAITVEEKSGVEYCRSDPSCARTLAGPNVTIAEDSTLSSFPTFARSIGGEK